MTTTTETAVTTAPPTRRFYITMVGIVVLTLGLVGSLIFWRYNTTRVYIEQSSIAAPLIALGPAAPGTLQAVFVHEGDSVEANTVVARVDTTLIKTTVAGTIVAVNNTIGTLVNPGTPVVTMIDPTALRVIGRLQEDKGLSDVHVGQRVLFTVDAFGSKEFYGVVDEVSPTSRESGIVFNISDNRATKQFDIKARFDVAAYPELKNGMSARMWVLK